MEKGSKLLQRLRENAEAYDATSIRAAGSSTPVENTDLPEVLAQASNDLVDAVNEIERLTDDVDKILANQIPREKAQADVIADCRARLIACKKSADSHKSRANGLEAALQDAQQEIRNLRLDVQAARKDRDYFQADKEAAASRLAQVAAALKEKEQRASRLEDAVFHFQSCRTCKVAGEDQCPDGSKFAAFLRGELDGD